jgi:hypothetical protein
MYFKDSNTSSYGAVYLEYANVANHGLGGDSGSVVISENATITFERIVPINITGAVELIRDADSLGFSPVIGSAANPTPQ